MEIKNENTLVNLSNSILKNFDVPTFHETIPAIDEVLIGHKKVVLMLFDGMGRNIVRKHLKESSFIRSHYLTTIYSTFAPTTAAATTAVLSAKFPRETGWLAWDVYFQELKRNIILFRGVDYNTGEQAVDNKYAYRNLPYEDIFSLISRNSPNTKTLNISRKPIVPNGPSNLRESYKQLNRALKEKNSIFIYYYFDSPDREMHEFGIDSHIVHRKVKSIDSFVKRVTKKNPDTLFLCIADHGHINVNYLNICDHNDLYSLLCAPLSFEKRSPNFFVKQDKIDEFKKLFLKYYGEHFDLVSHQEIIDTNLHGLGTPSSKYEELIGDFMAISKDSYALYADKEMKTLDLYKGHHAGGTDDERLIDVSVFNY